MSERRRRPNKVYKVEAVEAEAEAAAAETPETPETPPTGVLDAAAAKQRRKEVPPKAEEEAVVEEAPKSAKPTMPPGGIVRLPGVIPEAELAAITPAARQVASARQVALDDLSIELTNMNNRIAEQETRKQNAQRRDSVREENRADLELLALKDDKAALQVQIDGLTGPRGAGPLPTRQHSRKVALGRQGFLAGGESGVLPGSEFEADRGKAVPPGGYQIIPSEPLPPPGGWKPFTEGVQRASLQAPRLPPGWEDTDAAHAASLEKINKAIKDNLGTHADLKDSRQKFIRLREGTRTESDPTRWNRYTDEIAQLDRQIQDQERLVEQMERIRDVTLGAGGVRQAAANKFVKSNAAKK